MFTIAIPNRNRSLMTVQRTLDSLAPQCKEGVVAVVVDYGSEPAYQKDLIRLVEGFENIEVIICPTQGQLWQKTRAINIALKLCNTPFFMVADMDMIFHPQFVEKALVISSPATSTYFQVGVMTEEESKQRKAFNDYQIKFKTNEEATGITLFPTDVLKSINGFDEFYHGWGAEDTDVHVRLRNAGYTVRFYDEECLFLHQWHPKHYRSIKSTAPFHPVLEQINHNYLKLTKTTTKIKANTQTAWGVLPNEVSYKALKQPVHRLMIDATQEAVESFLAQLTSNAFNTSLQVEFQSHTKDNSLKVKIKKALGKRTPRFLKMSTVNELVLSTIITQLRNKPYSYSFNQEKLQICLDINLSELQ